MQKAKSNTTGFQQLPKDVLKRVRLGQAFAEYDLIRKNHELFVETPAIRAAIMRDGSKCIFVGRRGTGKTATTFYLENKEKNKTVLLLPQVFSIVESRLGSEDTSDVHQRPFKTLVNSFKRALLDEIVAFWVRRGRYSYRQSNSGEITRERNAIEQMEFDNRVLQFIEEGFETLDPGRERDWNRLDSRVKRLRDEVGTEATDGNHEAFILIDRIDDDWNGSEKSVVVLMALMHACVELNSVLDRTPILIFIRENMFDRVRTKDREFARLETAVVSLKWTREQLQELVERRLRNGLITKPALGGQTWDAFFEDGDDPSKSRDAVFEFCQYRPRDVITYCSFALDIAQSKLHSKIMHSDLIAAKRSFSENRLKELGDEYAENYPHLDVLLESFWGLSNTFTYKAIDDFAKKIVADSNWALPERAWIFSFCAPEALIALLYNVGFVGVQNGDKPIQYRINDTKPLSIADINSKSLITIHPSYQDALQLQPLVMSDLDDTVRLRATGMLMDLPDAINADQYKERLEKARDTLSALPRSREESDEFEEIIGEVIKLCFFRSLSNFEARSRTLGNRRIRDWVAGNHSTTGFWHMIRDLYRANQIIFECKNYDDLKADDFNQTAAYMNDQIGRFVVIFSRSQTEITNNQFGHIQDIANRTKGMVLLLGQRDLDILIRQALKSKSNENHLQEIFDTTVRRISS